MFKQVLNDPKVADYDSYAKSLLASLESAMEIAQIHSSAEQQHQARQYNRRVRGAYLSVGDRVLVANKSERGKRKLVGDGRMERTLLLMPIPRFTFTKSKMQLDAQKLFREIF